MAHQKLASGAASLQIRNTDFLNRKIGLAPHHWYFSNKNAGCVNLATGVSENLLEAYATASAFRAADLRAFGFFTGLASAVGCVSSGVSGR